MRKILREPINDSNNKRRLLFAFLITLGLFVVLLSVVIPKIRAGDTVVGDLTLHAKSVDESISLSVKDKNKEDTKVVIPLPAGVTYSSNSNPNIGVTYDAVNNQLVIDWVEGHAKKTTLQFVATKEGTYDFTARTVREEEPVTSQLCTVTIQGKEQSTSASTQDPEQPSTEAEPEPSTEESSNPNTITTAPTEQGATETKSDSETENVEASSEQAPKVQNSTPEKQPGVEVVPIPDAVLRKAVLKSMAGEHLISSSSESAVGEITTESIAKLKKIDATKSEVYKGVASLEGLQYATGLEILSLSQGEISDISYLKNLSHLKILRLNSYKISDLSPISNLPQLIALNLAGNKITDISSLKNLPMLNKMGRLDVSVNNISDISALKDLNFDKSSVSYYATTMHWTSFPLIGVANNHIRDVSPISGKEVTISGLTPFVEANNQTITLPSIELSSNHYTQKVEEAITSWNDYKSYDITPGSNSNGSGSVVGDTSIPGAPITVEWTKLEKQGNLEMEWDSIEEQNVVVTDNHFSGKIIQPYTQKLGKVTVNYVDTHGTKLQEPITLSDVVENSYETEQKEFPGYKLRKIEGNTTGVYTLEPQTVTYVYTTDELRFEHVPDTLSFEETKISNHTIESPRKDPNWKITVEDNRVERSNWRVTATLEEEFKDSSGQPIKGNALLFRKEGLQDQWIIPGTAVDVFDGTSNDETDYYDVSWQEKEGPLIQVAPGTVKADKYTGTINWQLVDAPA